VDGKGNVKLSRSSGQESWNVPFFYIGSYSHSSLVIVAVIIIITIIIMIIITIILLWTNLLSINFAYVKFVGYINNFKVPYRRHVCFYWLTNIGLCILYRYVISLYHNHVYSSSDSLVTSIKRKVCSVDAYFVYKI
jgi:hypothetical protein